MLLHLLFACAHTTSLCYNNINEVINEKLQIKSAS